MAQTLGTKKAKKQYTPEKQQEILEKMHEKHKAQNEIESGLWKDIDKQADKAIRLYRNKADYNEQKKEEIKAEIINRMANGQSITSICNNVMHMPAPKTILEWVEKDPLFGKNYAHARLQQADVLFNQCLDIADDSSRDTLEDKDGKKIVNHAAIQRDRLKIETRFRMAGKMSNKYADKAALVAEGATVTVNNLSINPRDMTPDSRDKLRKLLIEAKEQTVNKP